MLCMEIPTSCSEIHTKHINTMCEHGVESLSVKKILVAHVVTTGPSPFKPRIKSHLLFAGIISSTFSPR